MAKRAKRSFSTDFRLFFLRGLATLLPAVLTIFVLVKCFEFVQQNISVHITEGVIRLVVLVTEEYPRSDSDDLIEYITANKPGIDAADPQERNSILNDPKEQKQIRLWKLRDQWTHGLRSLVGFGLAIILVYVTGRILASYVGRKVWPMVESGVERVPGVKQVYPYVKQVTEFLFGENKIEFTRVVMVPYPRKGVWSLGLVTGAGMRAVSNSEKEEYLTVFVPSSPTPVTGYVVHVATKEVIDLPISIEEAFRFTISGGVIVPEHQALPRQRTALSTGATMPTKAEPERKEKA